MSDAYREGPPTCARCGRDIGRDENRATLRWLPYAVVHDGTCSVVLEDDLSTQFNKSAVVIKRALDFRVKDWGWFVFGLLAAIAACLGVYAIACGIFYANRVTACYTVPEETVGLPPKVHLYGQVDWHEDRKLGVFDGFDQAVEGARKINCPLDVPVRTPQ